MATSTFVYMYMGQQGRQCTKPVAWQGDFIANLATSPYNHLPQMTTHEWPSSLGDWYLSPLFIHAWKNAHNTITMMISMYVDYWQFDN